MEKLEIRIGTLRMHNPLMAVSGVFGIRYNELLHSLDGVGAVVAKSITFEPRPGNDEPRIIETPAGLLNSIGLQNRGVHAFLKEQLPALRVLDVPIIASIAGATAADYAKCAALLAPRDELSAIELNVSCPNVSRGGIEFGCEPKSLCRLVAGVRKVIGPKTLIVKLTPNVSDIALPAQAAIDGGADAIAVINTLRGMAIDVHTREAKLGNQVGGLSGKAIHPVAVYMVHRCYTSCCKRNRIPIIGIGGVSDGEDALELILAGATCVGVGTAMFRDQRTLKKPQQSLFEAIEEYLRKYLEETGEVQLNRLVGKVVRAKK